MANITCGVSPVTDVGASCSGNGACIFVEALGRSSCVCNAGWKGESDFLVTNSLLDCQISVVLIQVLWAIYLFLHIVLYVLEMPKLRWLWKKHERLVASSKAAGRSYTLLDNKGLLSFVPYVTVGWWMQLAYAITKIVNQDFKLGGGVFITIFYIIWRLTFYFCTDSLNPSLLASLLRSQRNVDHIISLNFKLSVAHFVVINLVSITTILPLVIPQDVFFPVVGMASVTVFYLTSALTMLFFGIQCAYISRKVEHILDQSLMISKDPRTKRIKEKISSFQRAASLQGFAQFFIYGVFGCFPYMWNKHDYLLPFGWLAVLSTVRFGINALVHQEDEDDSKRNKRGESIPEGSADAASGASSAKTESRVATQAV